MALKEIEEAFGKIENQGVANQVVDKLKELIVSKRLRPGDQLPSEEQLASLLSVGRGSIREALTVLRSHGVIKVIRGTGTFIASDISGSCYESLFFEIMTTEFNIDALSELRRLMEIGIIELIIKKNQDNKFENLQKIYDEMNAEIKRGPDERIIKLDIEFHNELVKYTQNELIEKIYMFTLELYRPYIIKSYDIQIANRSFDAVVTHKKIMEALKTQDISKMYEVVEYEIANWKMLFNKSHGN
ncbi:MAG: GntR family transcriptional regulator [Eubacteriales bacterium]|nr:GntR family transcriptional regulator [Eubacteriales bacterium]